MKKYTIVSLVLLTSLSCAPVFASESSGSEAASSSSSGGGSGDDRNGDRAGSSSSAEASEARAALVRALVASPQFRELNHQISAFMARLQVTRDRLVTLPGAEVAEEPAPLLRAITTLQQSLLAQDAVTTLTQLAHNLHCIARCSNELIAWIRNLPWPDDHRGQMSALMPVEITPAIMGLFLEVGANLSACDKAEIFSQIPRQKPDSMTERVRDALVHDKVALSILASMDGLSQVCARSEVLQICESTSFNELLESMKFGYMNSLEMVAGVLEKLDK